MVLRSGWLGVGTPCETGSRVDSAGMTVGKGELASAAVGSARGDEKGVADELSAEGETRL